VILNVICGLVDEFRYHMMSRKFESFTGLNGSMVGNWGDISMGMSEIGILATLLSEVLKLTVLELTKTHDM
jgi:hypothetical protein